jgi:hypothetical protein
MPNPAEPATGADWTPSEEQLARAQYYICQERHYFHRYCVLRNCPAFPLFFMDRGYDWQFESTGDVPIISRYNGLMELACRESWLERSFPIERLAAEIRRALAAGSQMALPIAFTHTDGTRYVTEWLIELIDDQDTVYYTKSTSDLKNRTFRKPVPFAELVEQIALTEDGLAPTNELRPAPTIETILQADPLTAFRLIFTEYGLRWEDDRLHRYVTPVTIGVDAIDRLIDDWQFRAERIVSSGVVDFNDQSRLNKHVQNKFQPVQHYLQFLLEDAELSAALGRRLTSRIGQDRQQMADALAAILKYGSLVVQLPRMQSFELYLKYLRQLRDVAADYQQTLLEIPRALTG